MTIAPDLQTNPLINPPKLRHDAPPLDIIRNEHFLPAIEFGIAEHQTEIDAIKANTEAPTFKNTIEALEFSGKKLNEAASAFYLFVGTKSDPEIRNNLTPAIGLKLSEHSNNINLDEVLFARIKAVHDDPASKLLGSEEQMLLNKIYRGYEMSGAALDPVMKQRYREIDARLTELTQQFSKNVGDSQGAFEKIVDPSELEGLPQDILDGVLKAGTDAGHTGKGLVKFNNAFYTIIEYAKSRKLREELSLVRRNIAYADPATDNRPVIMEIVKLRHEQAQLLGYKNHAEAILSDRMAKTPQIVNDFLQKNLTVYKPAAEIHLQKIRDFAADPARGDDQVLDLKPWDTAYYNRLLAQETFNLDMELLRPYYSLDNIIKGFHQHFEKGFGLEFREEKYPVHKSDVKVYEIFNKASNALAAIFYANYAEDRNPNSRKRDGAWMNAYRTRSVQDGKVIPPILENNCNFTRQLPGGPPTLLEKDHDETVHHEAGHFGHGIGASITKMNDVTVAKYPSLNGTNVKWDWVEVPSQLQENWRNNKEILKTYLFHNETGQPIPDDLLDKMLAMRTFGSGMAGLRQTYQAMIDMKWYTTDPADLTTVENLEREVDAIASVMPFPVGSLSTSFSHIFPGGYSAGYYSYKWAEACVADIFEMFDPNDLYNRQTWDQVIEHVYESGGTIDPDQTFRNLRGRNLDPDAMFRNEGLLPAKVGVAAQANNNGPWPFPKSPPAATPAP